MDYFDYESAAQEAGVPNGVLREWELGFQREYPGDDMMVELRLLRACAAAKGGVDQLDRVANALAQEFLAGSAS
ncbi:MAG: hypothetical protein AAB353_06255 [Candidatus Hydrogenedentota bacterium]